jgi:hypothetical protein
MARRTRPRAATPPASAESEAEVRITVSTQVGEDTFTYYANHAEIACTPHEFSLLFGRLPAKLPPDKLDEARTGNLTLISDVQILIPVSLIPGLMRALETQKATYESRYGTLHEPGASDAQSSS